MTLGLGEDGLAQLMHQTFCFCSASEQQSATGGSKGTRMGAQLIVTDLPISMWPSEAVHSVELRSQQSFPLESL